MAKQRENMANVKAHLPPELGSAHPSSDELQAWPQLASPPPRVQDREIEKHV